MIFSHSGAEIHSLVPVPDSSELNHTEGSAIL